MTASEGTQFTGEVASFDRAETATVDWGDRTSSVGTIVYGSDNRAHVSGSHSYAEGGTFTVVATVQYCGNLPACATEMATTTATVSDPALSAAGTTLSATTGMTFSGTVATLGDADQATAASEYTTVIDWGDGTSGSGTVSADPRGGYAISGSHTYTSAGTWPVKVAAADAGGSTAGATSSVTVSDPASPPPATPPTTTGPPPPSPAPSAAFTTSPSTVAPGAPVAFDASASRPDGTTVARYEWSLDGHQVAVCDGRTSEVSTELVDPGAHRVDLTVVDASGRVTTAAGAVTVAGRPGGAGADLARAAGAPIHPIRAETTYICLPGPRDPLGPIESVDNRAAGAGCSTQIEAGIAEAVGCFAPHSASLDVKVEHLRNTSTITSVLLTAKQALPGVPLAESTTYEEDIASYFFRARSADFCLTVPASAQYEYCNVPEGAGSLAPPSTYCKDPTNLSDPTCTNGGGVGGRAPPPPAPGKAHTTAVSPAAARSSGSPIAGAELITPCTRDTVDPGNGQSVIEHPCVQLYVATTPVVVNGLRYQPAPGAVILVSPEFHLVISSSASIWFHGIRLHDNHAINLQVPETPTGASTDFPDLTVPDISTLLDPKHPTSDAARRPADEGGIGSLGGFPTSPGSLHVGFDNRVSIISFEVDLPFPINDGSGHHATAHVRVQVDPDGTPHVLDAGVRNVNVFLGPVAVRSFSACWRAHDGPDNPCPAITGISPDPRPATSGFWDATGELAYGSVTLVFRPAAEGFPPICGSNLYGIGFDGGHLDFAGAGLDLGVAGIPIGPGVTLNRLAAEFNATNEETRFCALAQFRVASIVHFDAHLLALWERAGHTHSITAAELPGLPDPVPVTHFALGASGVVTVHFPVAGDVQLGDGYALYHDAPSTMLFGAHAGFGLGDDDNGIGVDGRVDGGVTLGGGYPFWIEGSLHAGAHVKLGRCPFCATAHADASGEAIISHGATRDGSDGGIAVCGSLSAGGGFAGFSLDINGSGAIKYHWGEGFSHFLRHGLQAGGGCDFIPDLRLRPARAAGTGISVRVGPGLRAVDLYLDGQSGSPDVHVTGPGVDVTTHPSGTARTRSVSALRFPAPFKLTDIFLSHPRPGVYRITPVPGSPAIAAVRRSDGVTPHVTATVTGHGALRSLRFRVATHPGQRIDFRELSSTVDRAIGSTRAAAGTISFPARPGHGRRRIVAEIVQDGLAVERLTVASYLPAAPVRLPRVHGLTASRRGTTVRVAFRRVPGATGYRLVLAMRDGVRTVLVTRATHPTLTGALAEFGGRLAVTPLGDGTNTLDAPAAVAGVAPALRRR